MKGITNATKGAADVVQDDTKVSVLGVNLQEATDSQSGLMSKADHSTLSTTATRVGTCENDISALQATVTGKQDKLTAGTNITISGNTISASGGTVTAGEGISISGTQVSLKSVHSGYNSVGGSTYAPQFNVDKYGRVTSVSETRVYPPTTAGTSGQVWTSTGSGSGKWADAQASSSSDDWVIYTGSLSNLLDTGYTNYTVKRTFLIEYIYQNSQNVCMATVLAPKGAKYDYDSSSSYPAKVLVAAMGVSTIAYVDDELRVSIGGSSAYTSYATQLTTANYSGRESKAYRLWVKG